MAPSSTTSEKLSLGQRCRERGGHEIDARADEFFAVFERAAAAMDAAVVIAALGLGGNRARSRRSRDKGPCRDPQRPPEIDQRGLHRSAGSHHGARLLGRSRRSDRRDRGGQGRRGSLGAGRAALPQPRRAPVAGTGRSQGAVSGRGRRPRDRLPAAERRLERRAAQSPYGSKVSAPPAPRRSGTARADRSPRRRRPARRRLSGGAPRRPLILDGGPRARPLRSGASTGASVPVTGCCSRWRRIPRSS